MYVKSKGLGVVLCALLAATVALDNAGALISLVPGRPGELANLVILVHFIGNMALLTGMVVTLIFAIYSVIWARRLLGNLPALNVSGLRIKDWYLWGFLVPVVNLFLPVIAFQEIWKASDPNNLDSGGWKQSPASKAIYAWWLVWFSSHVLGVASYFWHKEICLLAVCVLDIVATFLSILMIGQMSDRQDTKYEVLAASRRGDLPR